MPPSPFAAISVFRRRIGRAALVAGGLQGLLVTAIVWALTLVVVRLCGAHLPPTWWWLLLALPVLLFAWWRWQREAMVPAVAAVHLDRRLGLGGLLLCAGERQVLDGPWQRHLEQRLAALPQVLPRLRWRRLLPAPLLAAGLCALTASLPPPPEARRPRALPTFQAEVGRLGAQLRDLFERGEVPDEVESELEQKLQQLREQVEAGAMPEWRDIDELEQRISREQLMQLAGDLQGRGASGSGGGESRARSLGSLMGAARALAKMGLLDKINPRLAGLLESVRNADGSFDLDQLGLDAAGLQALAEAFGDAFEGMDFGELDLGALGLDPGMLGDLRALAAGLGQGAGAGAARGRGAGRGGVTRGPGHAALSFTESAVGGADQVMPLPPGRGLPKDWVPVGSERIVPVVAPVTNRQPGAAGAAGTGGATWQLEYAPRHRAVLRRFFSEAAK